MASFAHQDVVNDVAFSPDGARILTASADHSAKLWDAGTGELITSFLIRVRFTTWRLVRMVLEFSRQGGSHCQALGRDLGQAHRLL